MIRYLLEKAAPRFVTLPTLVAFYYNQPLSKLAVTRVHLVELEYLGLVRGKGNYYALTRKGTIRALLTVGLYKLFRRYYIM
ncbi:MAG: hypothetical protein DRQ89_12775 [Epsilonproteobacteria bacterium]|nr:MAG: hypothetical protein DRQ89_12775 [Campylobacterota bacterium]